ncbi:uncharacterized protein PHALS_14291 [Plasmopara halstedii]|uniref:Uncharacterized protein n=1 Tax=Plasmopara halstedii TaxID=4781 RepID=A0A0P1ARZ0_PLAHL|nr:uncharacterized protein PHALS_14291 [Plasmopara halstedii]CEG44018.1 hypothetical protein PHALS_14291 [Plasmopara halstedii]|eukprot:XP_024580387.1 hypothetical protein PHALS_14291 [Plasmopara halstedii]
MASNKPFDHTAHAEHRWRRLMNVDLSHYLGFSFVAGGLHIAKSMALRHRSKGMAFLRKKAFEKLPKLMIFPLIVGIPGAELLLWGASYINNNKGKDTSEAARDTRLVPAAFVLYGTALNSVHPLDGRLRRLRTWIRPFKWGVVGWGIDGAISKYRATSSKLKTPVPADADKQAR